MTRRMPPTETVRMALTTLRSNRLRSLLTMVGIVIGNASVITLVGVGRGAQGLAEEQLSNLGANVLFVVPGNNDTRRRGVAFPKTLVLEDAEAIAEQVPSVRRGAPQITSSQVVQAGARTTTSSVSGITADFLPVRSFEIARGRFISQQDNQAARAVTVIGPDLRSKLFPTGEPLGQQLRIGTQAFEVIGVMAPKGAVFGSNQDENAYIPLSTMVTRLTGRDPTYGVSLSFISVEARNEASTNAAKFQITNLLRQRHRILRDDDFAVRSLKIPHHRRYHHRWTHLDACRHWWNLLVGGRYRNHEHHVGIRQRANRGDRVTQALGARSGDVMQQSWWVLVLSSLGGAIGTAASWEQWRSWQW